MSPMQVQLGREDWLSLARKLDRDYSYVSERELFPAVTSGEPWLSYGEWQHWGEPFHPTFRDYVATQLEILSAIETAGYDHELQPGWATELADTISAIRFPLHGFSMAAAYVAQMGPVADIAAMHEHLVAGIAGPAELA